MSLKIDRRSFVMAGSALASLARVRSARAGVKPSQIEVVGLKVENIDRPLGLEITRPKMSWRLKSEERNVRQSAVRILVASSEEQLESGHADLWDSGRVSSNKSIGIEYQGRLLTSRQRCWWNVQV